METFDLKKKQSVKIRTAKTGEGDLNHIALIQIGEWLEFIKPSK